MIADEIAWLAEQGRLALGDHGPNPRADDPLIRHGVELLNEALYGIRDLVAQEDPATALQALAAMEPSALRLLAIVAAIQLEAVGVEAEW